VFELDHDMLVVAKFSFAEKGAVLPSGSGHAHPWGDAIELDINV